MEVVSVDKPQVSGKVFRFLSAMHPSLSKAERKRYAGYDPDKWYEWTPEVSREFTELMRRTPRDTSFARGFAYVAQRAVPEGQYIPTAPLLDNLTALPAAYRGPEGSGFRAAVDRPGHAMVAYSGMPGFSNVCIAVQGELVQRMQASGAQGVVVKHGETCRVSGAEECCFELEWAGEAAPGDATAADIASLVGGQPAAASIASTPGRPDARETGPATTARSGITVERRPDVSHMTPSPTGGASLTAQPSTTSAPVGAVNEVGATASPAAAAGMTAALASDGAGRAMLETAFATGSALDGGALSSAALDSASDDLFTQLHKRLAEADRQTRMYADAQAQIDTLRIELERVCAQAEADVSRAQTERDEAEAALAELKRRVRGVLGEA